MPLVKALGIAKSVCGWGEASIEAHDIAQLLSNLPVQLSDMYKKGEVVIIINGTELRSADRQSLNESDSVYLLPVVHGG
ncbi:MAG: hypothetical protein QXQ39_01115 [Conexivisphaerales archaeon]